MSKRDTAHWRACREFHGREWGDGAVIYDAASGDTHHLALMAFQILTLIHSSPCTQEELASRVLSSDSATPDEEFFITIESIVNNLYGLGFIEPEHH